jgi:cell shape-determining protein MreC
MALMFGADFSGKLTWWQQALLILIAASLLELTGLSQPVVGLVSRGVEPVRQLWVGGLSLIYRTGDSLQKLPKAAQRIQDLELRLAEASAALAELETLRKENQELKFLLGNSDLRGERGVITSPVIAFSQPAIAAGQSAGIQQGAVVLSRNTLLGQVAEVHPHQSSVTLLSEKNAQPILAKTESGVRGLIMGDGRKVVFTEVAKQDVLTMGERIVTMGQPQIEQDLPIGKIIKINDDPTASIKSAIVEQYVSFFETPLVEVR